MLDVVVGRAVITGDNTGSAVTMPT